MTNTTEEQLVSFFLYSLFIYPVTNYLVSPKRSYPRWKGACYAMLFLVAISSVHMMYENREKGPNHYNLLGVARGTSTANLKRAYRNLSLELHPDKNKSPTAPEEFRKVKHAFDVLLNPDTRQVYERLGDAGVKASAQTVISHKYIVIQMLVYYCSSVIFTFLMTFAEASGDAMTLSFFGLLVVLLVECSLVLEQVPIPVWLLPHHTAHDVVSLLRRVYPAFMNGCRCITGAFENDPKASRVEVLTELLEASRSVTQRSSSLLQTTVAALQHMAAHQAVKDKVGGGGDASANAHDDGRDNTHAVSMADALRLAPSRVDGTIAAVLEKASVVLNPAVLRSRNESNGSNLIWLRNLAIFVLARFIVAYKSKSSTGTGSGSGSGGNGGGGSGNDRSGGASKGR